MSHSDRSVSEVEGTVPSAWYLDAKARADALAVRLVVAEAYIPSRDFGDYLGDADKAVSQARGD